MMLILEPTPLARGLVRMMVEVLNYPDGRFAVQFNGTGLGFRLFDKIQTVQPGDIVDNKRLSAVLEQVKAQQAAYPARQQRGHPARQRPPNNLEAPGLPSKGRASRQVVAALSAPRSRAELSLVALVFRYVASSQKCTNALPTPIGPAGRRRFRRPQRGAGGATQIGPAKRLRTGAGCCPAGAAPNGSRRNSPKHDHRASCRRRGRGPSWTRPASGGVDLREPAFKICWQWLFHPALPVRKSQVPPIWKSRLRPGQAE